MSSLTSCPLLRLIICLRLVISPASTILGCGDVSGIGILPLFWSWKVHIPILVSFIVQGLYTLGPAGYRLYLFNSYVSLSSFVSSTFSRAYREDDTNFLFVYYLTPRQQCASSTRLRRIKRPRFQTYVFPLLRRRLLKWDTIRTQGSKRRFLFLIWWSTSTLQVDWKLLRSRYQSHARRDSESLNFTCVSDNLCNKQLICNCMHIAFLVFLPVKLLCLVCMFPFLVIISF